MYYVYVLKSEKEHIYYVGSTKDLRIRFVEHNTGKSNFTKKHMPWTLVYYEAYLTNKLVVHREYALKKRAKAWQELLKRLDIER